MPFMSMSMISMCRGISKGLGSPAFALKPRIGALAVFPCIYHCGDFPTFVEKRAPYFLPHQTETSPRNDSQPQASSVLECCHLGNMTNNIFIQDQVRLSNAYPPPKQQLSTEGVGKILRFVHLDVVKTKLRSITDACISYAQLLELCMDCKDENVRRDMINMLEQSGTILRIGHTVYLHPDQVARAVESVLPRLVDDCRSEELRKMDKEKAKMDAESERLVRKELWCGLGFFTAQTAVFFRLTFWELSWDIMEPICFYLTSVYFILGYAFFIRTSRDPTLESFYAARINAKQRKLMKSKKFNLERYRELQMICRPLCMDTVRPKYSVTRRCA